MDLGTMGLEGLVSLDSGFPGLSSFSEEKLKLFGSDGLLEQERPGSVVDDWKNSKMAKTVDFSAYKETGRNRLLGSEISFSDDQKQEQMLVFASPKSSDSLSVEKSSLDAALPYIHHGSAGGSRNEVHESGSLSYGVGLFTQSQWMELGNQALIYKYITSNVPVPSHLLLPIRKALHSAASSCFSGGFLKPSSFGWGGSFHVGFNNADPEPGRCRRTDGKKWRCSREAVADQKYCERHINRGRHRSRKPVEGLAGHSVAGNFMARNNATMLISLPLVSAVDAGGESYNSLGFTDQQRKTVSSQPSAPSLIERMLINRERANSASIDVQSASMPFFIQKHQIPFQESERSGFRTVSSESLFNPCLEDCQFANATKNQGHQSAISWPDLEFESEITQLTMSSSFPPSEKPSDCLKMNLGTGRIWETSIGGPLGEVLHQTNNDGGLTIGTGVLR